MQERGAKVKVFLVALCAAATLTGCVATTQMFVGPGGVTNICQSHGQGIIGITHASKIQKSCEDSMQSAGMLKIEDAGVVGITGSNSMVLLSVHPKGPAAAAGVQPGWKVLRVNEQLVSTWVDAASLIFGPAGESVSFLFDTEDGERSFTLIRASRPEVLGTSAPEEEEEIEPDQISPFSNASNSRN